MFYILYSHGVFYTGCVELRSVYLWYVEISRGSIVLTKQRIYNAFVFRCGRKGTLALFLRILIFYFPIICDFM